MISRRKGKIRNENGGHHPRSFDPLFAQSSGTAAAKPEHHLSDLEVRQIVLRSIDATERSWAERDRYLYTERDEGRYLDANGRVKSGDVDISKITFVNDVPFEQLVEHNGRPPSAEVQRRQAEKLDKLKRETGQERAARLREQQESRSFIREVPEGFDFQLVGEEVVNGRPAYVLRATRGAGYRGHGTYGKMMSKVEGKLWVDKQDYGWVKVDGEVAQPFSMGLFLAHVLRDSHITMEQARFDDGFWMPTRAKYKRAPRSFSSRVTKLTGYWLTLTINCNRGPHLLCFPASIDRPNNTKVGPVCVTT